MKKGTKIALIIGGVLVLGVGGFFVYKRFFKKSKGTKNVDYASKIKEAEKPKNEPKPFTQTQAKSYAYKLYKSMKGVGTDEDLLFKTLKSIPKTRGNEVYMVMGSFNKHYGNGDTLDEWFDDDLSGSDLSKAKSYFQ
jgi:hypothetical protein